jgi:hypothetical protein
MAKSTFDAHSWTLGVTSLNDGEAKFRANDAWDVSWEVKQLLRRRNRRQYSCNEV